MKFSKLWNLVNHFFGEWYKKKIHYDIMKTSPKNGYIFPGSSSKLSYDVEFLIDWTCNFNLQYYPFGTHRYIMSKMFIWILTCKSRCTMEFYIERKEVILQPREVSYSGRFICKGGILLIKVYSVHLSVDQSDCQKLNFLQTAASVNFGQSILS